MTGAFTRRAVRLPLLLGVCLAAILAVTDAGAEDAVSTLPAKVLLDAAGIRLNYLKCAGDDRRRLGMTLDDNHLITFIIS